MVQLERGRPTQGILYDMMLSLATQVGVPAEFRIARRQGAKRHGARARSTSAVMPRNRWLPNQPGDYIWSIPLCTPT